MQYRTHILSFHSYGVYYIYIFIFEDHEIFNVVDVTEHEFARVGLHTMVVYGYPRVLVALGQTSLYGPMASD